LWDYLDFAQRAENAKAEMIEIGGEVQGFGIKPIKPYYRRREKKAPRIRKTLACAEASAGRPQGECYLTSSFERTQGDCAYFDYLQHWPPVSSRRTVFFLPFVFNCFFLYIIRGKESIPFFGGVS
jgi:hypothetical protein